MTKKTLDYLVSHIVLLKEEKKKKSHRLHNLK